MGSLDFTILGCGSSGGVPRLGGNWGDCDPNNPKNYRRRCSMLVERKTPDGTTRVLIDTSPDLRAQLLDANVGALDAALFTHSHADHVHGLDDLRMIVFNMRKRLAVWADKETSDSLMERFSYAFVQPQGSPYPPILDLNLMSGTVVVDGAGGKIKFQPFEVEHGNINALGFRMGPLAYLPDVSAMPPKAWQAVMGTDCWVLDALRRTPHPSHSHLEQSLEWVAKTDVKKAVLTNMHIDLDYDTLCKELPKGVQPAYDGMTLSYDL
ncbi:MAG: MBL fold metallo-hydrolase [Paracoccaceae bacterium]|nr:MBL fold metallo-hydrolase [Paracoccaceae bacterium]